MSNETLAALAADVQSGECSIAQALGRAYSLGYSAGKSDRHEQDASRIVRVGEGFTPEVRSNAN
jgi:hypothetical protein